ncbi:DUF2986 domain-containing protein [Enterovibrio baiacu]|uniref:DUF2986 domain-containing protein n=1 Tax=Enterovibrio baiacu TaxID=2491023 RepID=UPI00101033BB|nr:DUF2986 domain-containing protein [Enterovibrio baiacu]MBE1275394.1 DUF2986 domain-containing protein [Enterovibrio baiacu]
MNRKKKVNQILKSRAKKKSAKLKTSNKPKYISKADRAKMALEAEQGINAENTDVASVYVENVNDAQQDTAVEEAVSNT